jgi:hypothetical protein
VHGDARLLSQVLEAGGPRVQNYPGVHKNQNFMVEGISQQTLWAEQFGMRRGWVTGTSKRAGA